MAAPNDEENNDSANSQIPLPTEQNSTDNQASTDLPLIAAAGGHIFTNDPAVTLQARVEGVPGTVHYLPPGVCLQQVLTQASVYSTIDRLEALQANTSAPVSASDGQVATTATSTSEEQVSTSAAAPDSEKHGSTGGGIKNTPEKVTAVITSSESRATTLKSDTQDDIEATCSDSEGPDIPTPTSSEVDDMSSHEEGVVKVKLLPKPEGWKGDPGNPNFKTLGTISAPVMRKVEPVGPAYLQFARMKSKGRTFSEDERIEAEKKVVKKIEKYDDDDEISEPEDPLMLARDPKDWRGQDHYAVLGLSKYRWRATEEQLHKAHQKKILRHHPDKKAAKKQNEDDSFFKCIQRAQETLYDPIRRRQYDSVDPAADVDPPSKKDVQKRGFYKAWNPVFESEARFSNVKPVPMLGDDNSTQEEVERFYDFWFNFDSWRSFEYLDEDVPDDNADRDHKRHIERKNANARRKKKTEDTARLRAVVDKALEQDERIKKFRQANKANRNKKKNELEAAARREAEEKQKAKEEEERKQKEAEEAAKAEKAESKKAKEAAKNAVKKNKRVLKSSVKDVNYFVSGGDASPAQVDGVLTDVELIMGKIDADELAALASKLSLAGKDAGKVKGAYEEEAKRLKEGGKIKEGELKVVLT